MEKEQCSKLFGDVFDSHGGGQIRVCACGRTYFSVDESQNWEEGELEDIQKKQKVDPDSYIHWDSTVWTLNVGGKEIVWGCCCDTAHKYEQFLINEGPRIAKYLNRRAKALREHADLITATEILPISIEEVPY